MGNLTRSGAQYWEDDQDADIPAATLALAESLDDNVIAKFDTLVARNAGETGGSGSLHYVAETGLLYLRAGSTNYPIPVQGLTFVEGNTDVTTSGLGLFNIAHPFGSAAVTASINQILAGPQGAAEAVAADTKLIVHSYQNGYVAFWATQISDRQPRASASLRVSYRIARIL